MPKDVKENIDDIGDSNSGSNSQVFKPVKKSKKILIGVVIAIIIIMLACLIII